MDNPGVLNFIFVLIFALMYKWLFSVQRKLRAIDRKLDMIVEYLELQDESLTPQIQQLLLQGKKIEAIKYYREQTASQLVDAKDEVDRIEAKLRGRSV
jgi:ribosomal protein L7/L12